MPASKRAPCHTWQLSYHMSDAPPPPDRADGEFTLLLQRAETGDASAAEKILPLVYGEPEIEAAEKETRRR